MTVPADVVVYGAAGDALAEQVREIWAELDVTARLAVVGPIDAGTSWMVVASIPVRLVYEQLDAARSGSGDGRSAAARVAGAADRLTRLQPGRPDGLLLLQDTETGMPVVVVSGLPEAAFSSLATVDLAAYTFGPLHYDLDAGRWRSIMDDWSPA